MLVTIFTLLIDALYTMSVVLNHSGAFLCKIALNYVLNDKFLFICVLIVSISSTRVSKHQLHATSRLMLPWFDSFAPRIFNSILQM